MIGIEMEIRQLEWSVFINNYIRNHNFDACILGWVFGMKGDPKQVWHSESAKSRGSNHIEFMNAEADSLIDAARVEFDLEKRVAMYRRFQNILHEEQPYTFLFSTMRKPAFDRRFRGVRWYPFRPGYLLNEWFVPKDEQKFE
jgi:peptide/nickel transport system substrate-binding protein